MLRLTRQQRLEKLSALCRGNSDALMRSLEYCEQHGIGAFRINSQILPVKTHSEAGYDISELPGTSEIISRFQECGHSPDPDRFDFHFILINSSCSTPPTRKQSNTLKPN
jgi:UV DNA damage endonuclease